MELDKDLETEAYKWANEVCSQIYDAQMNIGKPLPEDVLTLYYQLKAFSFFETYDPNNNAETIRALALIKYRDLLWHKAHPAKPKLSKWEIVTGKKSQ